MFVKVTALKTAALLLLLGSSGTVAKECEANGTCELEDMHERCPVWKEEGECIKSSEYMEEHCPKSCATLDEDDSDGDDSEPCVDDHHRCSVWASIGECDRNPINMHRYCRKSCQMCDSDELEDQELSRSARESDIDMTAAKATEDFGVLQRVEGSERLETMKVVHKSIVYMLTEATSLPESVLKECLNRHDLCAFWASIGECEANQAFMVTNCAPSCQSCHLIDIETRCPPLPKETTPALVPGGLNNMFERIVKTAPGNRTLTDSERIELQQQGMTHYTVTVHSSPSASPAKSTQPLPWVVTFDNFTTPEESQHLIDLGFKHGYERSQDVGSKKFDGSYDGVLSDSRTSENAWCSSAKGCRQDEVADRIHKRMGKIMGIDPNNSEDLQLLKYEVGQFYRVHHDFIAHQQKRQCGPRILTFFLYLSDVEAGGGTSFPSLGIKVEPKKGRALLWPSILDSDPFQKDGRMVHEALAVEAGTKFAANGWIHMYDYVTAQAKGCT